VPVQASSVTSSPITKALVEAHCRGGKVEVILDVRPFVRRLLSCGSSRITFYTNRRSRNPVFNKQAWAFGQCS